MEVVVALAALISRQLRWSDSRDSLDVLDVAGLASPSQRCLSLPVLSRPN